MTSIRLAITLALLVLLAVGFSITAAAPPLGVGTPSMQLACGDDGLTPGTATLLLRGLEVADEGAAGFNAMVVYDHDVMTLEGYVGGQRFLNLPGCAFVPSSPVAPGTGGTYDYFSGACTTIPAVGASGDFNLARLIFVKKDGAPDGTYPVQLVTGEEQFGVPYTAIYDSSPEGDTYYVPASDLIDGEVRFGVPCSAPPTETPTPTVMPPPTPEPTPTSTPIRPYAYYFSLVLLSNQATPSQAATPSPYLPLLLKLDAR